MEPITTNSNKPIRNKITKDNKPIETVNKTDSSVNSNSKRIIKRTCKINVLNSIIHLLEDKLDCQDDLTRNKINRSLIEQYIKLGSFNNKL